MPIQIYPRVVLGLVSFLVIFGQTPAVGPAFEVASVEPTSEIVPASVVAGHTMLDGARLDTGSISLTDLIGMAYRVKAAQISGPDWMAQQRFHVQAKLPQGASKGQVPEMLQALLAERFELTIHRDEKVMPVFDLVVTKKGPQMKEPAQDSPPAGCPQSSAKPGMRGINRNCNRTSMAELADWLPGMALLAVDRPVVDRTGIHGDFDFPLAWQPMAGSRRGDGSGAVDEPNVTLFDALEKIGLKLDPQKEKVTMIVVDHVERRPTEN